MDAPQAPKHAPSSPMTIFALAFSFLTLLPLPSRWLASVTDSDLARSLAVFPIVGLFLGAILVFLANLLPGTASPLLPAAILTALLCLLTRALHLDGLADVADGFGGGYTPEKRLTIMKDSRTGAFGVVAIVLILTLKTAAIEILISTHSWPFLAVGPMLGRFAMVAAAFKSSYARKEGGLGKSFIEQIAPFQILVATATATLLSVALAGPLAFIPITLVLGFVALARLISRRMIGGLTGDVLGAINEISETLAWIAFAMLSQPH